MVNKGGGVTEGEKYVFVVLRKKINHGGCGGSDNGKMQFQHIRQQLLYYMAGITSSGVKVLL